MRYLVLSSSYGGSCLADEFSESFEISELNLDEQIKTEIDMWNEEYKKVIYLCTENRDKMIELDRKGLNLAQKILNSIQEDIKIKYLNYKHQIELV